LFVVLEKENQLSFNKIKLIHRALNLLKALKGILGLLKKINYFYNFINNFQIIGKQFLLTCLKEQESKLETGYFFIKRFINVLDPNINHSEWTEDED
jgi:hypothetical protein